MDVEWHQEERVNKEGVYLPSLYLISLAGGFFSQNEVIFDSRIHGIKDISIVSDLQLWRERCQRYGR